MTERERKYKSKREVETDAAMCLCARVCPGLFVWMCVWGGAESTTGSWDNDKIKQRGYREVSERENR